MEQSHRWLKQKTRQGPWLEIMGGSDGEFTWKGNVDDVATKERKNALHVVSVWSYEDQLVLGQVEVDDKSNEITAIPELLSMLDIENTIITLDAMGCQKEIAKQVIHQNADYVLELKGNHSGLQAELEAWWHKCQREGFNKNNYDEFIDNDFNHSRIESRCSQRLLIDTQWLATKYRWKGNKRNSMVHQFFSTWCKASSS